MKVTPILTAHDIKDDCGMESLVERIARQDAMEKKAKKETNAPDKAQAHIASLFNFGVALDMMESKNVVEHPVSVLEEENNGLSESCVPSGVQIHLSAEIVNLLNGLFGDGTESTKSSHVQVPLWICEYLYRATQNMEIPEYLPEHTEIPYCPEVSESDSNESSENGQSSPSYLPANHLQPAPPLSNEERLVMLNTLYQMFSTSIPMKEVMKCAKENNFDPEQTYLILANAVSAFDDIRPEKNSNTTDPKMKETFVIVPSKSPTIIIPQKKESLNFTRNNHYDSLVNQYTMQQVEELREQASQLRNKQDHYINMESINTKKLLNGHYLGKAREQNKEAEELLLLSDYIELYITKEEHFIDLHTLTGDRALEMVKNKIDLCREKYPYQKKLHIITGYGKTTGRPSVLKAKIRRFLEQKRIDYHPDDRNQGVLVVKLGSIKESLT